MNAIITAATGYSENDLNPFLNSIQQNCRETKVFLICYKEDSELIKNLKRKYQFIKPISIRKKKPITGDSLWEKLHRKYVRLSHHILSKSNFKFINPLFPLFESIGKSSLHIAVERYFIALQVVRKYGRSCSNILLTDSRDVVLQSNPFNSIDGRLITGLEKKKIKDCQYNSEWIELLYGEKVLRKMSEQQIVCSGVILGTVEKVEQYLSEMCDKMWSILPKIAPTYYDQGIHNHLCYESKLPIHLTDNREGLIATLGYEQDVLKDSASGLVQVGDLYPAIVHQYDRHPDLQTFFKKKYAFPERNKVASGIS
jgi:hypothetical protein